MKAPREVLVAATPTPPGPCPLVLVCAAVVMALGIAGSFVTSPQVAPSIRIRLRGHILPARRCARHGMLYYDGRCIQDPSLTPTPPNSRGECPEEKC
jgi:hypothetical protein